MRKALFLILAAVSIVACKKDINQEEVVGNAAKQYYTYLLEGKYEAFVDGCYQKDSIREEYRNQLIDNAKMFVGQQKKEHEGIKSVDIVSAKIDTASHTANVFLNLHYGDKTSEQVVLPMIEKENLWYMR